MRPKFTFIAIFSALFLLSLFSCKKKTEEFITEPIADYIPLAVGKYITYRIDSLVFTNFGRNAEIHRYQVKHVVDAQISDNLGRPSFRVFTYLNDSTGSETWTPNGSYFITPLADQAEVVENNFRFIKMHLPIREGYEWKGNKYLPIEPYLSIYDFSNDQDIREWDYFYDTFEPMFSYQGVDYTDVITVEQQNEASNAPVTDPLNYGSMSRSVEKYSKNIGLVYRKYELWEYQPNPSGPSPFRLGFGVVMWMVDHN